MKQVSYTKVKDHKGSKRLWIEGVRLKDCGFEAGVYYDREFDSGVIKLTLNKGGAYKVSGRKKSNKIVPIIDICKKDLEFDVGTRVEVKFYCGAIIISAHHEDLSQERREKRLKDNIKSGTILEGSACTGIGVSALAIHESLEDAGFKASLSWVIEREGKYIQVASDNNPAVDPSTVLFEASLEEIKPELLTEVDLLSFSLPCTGHSKSGKTKNAISVAEAHPTDATAIFGIREVIRKSNPAVISSENVKEAKNSASYLLLKAELQRLGYVIFEYILNGKEAGTLEHRERYLFTAVSKGLSNLVDFLRIRPQKRQYENLGEVLETIPDTDPRWSDNEYLKTKESADIAAGKGFRRQLVNEKSVKVGCIGRHYNKRRSTEPFVVREDGKERLLTPLEHAKVKGIPEMLVDGVAVTTGHEGLGQSVLYPHVKSIMQPIVEMLHTLRVSSV